MPEVSTTVSGSDLDLQMEEDMENLNKEIKDLKDALHREKEPEEILKLKEALHNKEQALTDLKEQCMDLQNRIQEEMASPRRSGRKQVPTEKMMAYQNETEEKRLKAFDAAYGKWKETVRIARKSLKSNVPEEEVELLIDEVTKTKENVLRLFLEMREHVTPDMAIRRRVDTCESIS